MAKCNDCGAETKNMVWEPNICREIPLCNYCKDAFYRKCKICGQYYPLKELNLVTLVCRNCMDSSGIYRRGKEGAEIMGE